jgi:hypothetical protein
VERIQLVTVIVVPILVQSALSHNHDLSVVPLSSSLENSLNAEKTGTDADVQVAGKTDQRIVVLSLSLPL